MPNNSLQTHILENLNTAVLLFDSGLRVTYTNPAGEILFSLGARQIKELSSEELIGKNNRMMALLNKARDEGRSLTDREIELELPAARERITVDCTVTPLLEPRQEPMILVELQQIDRQLRILREENLLQQQAATSAVVRGLAHEINNPLGGLRGAAQLLQKELADETLHEYTDIIIGEADRLQKLLAQILGPRTVPHRRNCNIHELLERVRTLVLAEKADGIKIHRDYDPSIPLIHADPDQIIQAVLNIARNAVQALGDNGEITLRTRTKRQYTIGTQRHKLVASIEIIDNGPGIPAALAEKIFFPMVTGRAEGTGLGLSIAQSLVNQHKGIIECTSRPGHTTFMLLLPLDRNHD